jgi:iron complex transport system ATP-binding protein
MSVVLACRGLAVTVPERRLIENLDLDLRGQRILAVLGRNGAGKTSLLHALAGLREPAAGEVLVNGRARGAHSRRALGRLVGLLPQSSEDLFPGSVFETVLTGRHPHIDFWGWEGPEDRAKARSCLSAVGLAESSQRDVATLSGGERRRLAIATLLAQDPLACLLDEPLDQLDPQHQVEVLALLRALAERGRAVAFTVHDPGVAARHADDALLLHGDGRWICGPVDEVLDARALGELYGVAMRELRYAAGRSFVAEPPA